MSSFNQGHIGNLSRWILDCHSPFVTEKILKIEKLPQKIGTVEIFISSYNKNFHICHNMMIPYCLIEMKTKDFVKRIQGFEFDRSNSRNPEWITNKEDAYFFSLFHKGKWKVSQRIVFEDVHKLTYLFLGEAFFSLKDQKIP